MTTASYVGAEEPWPTPDPPPAPTGYAAAGWRAGWRAGWVSAFETLVTVMREDILVPAAPDVPSIPGAREAVERLREIARNWDDLGPYAATEFLVAAEALIAVLDGSA